MSAAWAWAAAGLLALSAASWGQDATPEGPMDEALVGALRAGEWSAAMARAVEVGPAAAEAVASSGALEHEAPERRLLGIEVLKAVGGERAIDLLIDVLEGDGSEQVRVAACHGLHAHPPAGREARLLVVWDKSRSAVVRREVPLILGRVPRARPEPLRERLTQLDAMRDGLVAGLARLGDLRARARFARMLASARGKRVVALLELVAYIDQPWLLPLLAPLLARTEVVDILATHQKTYERRACDVAVDEVVRQGGEAVGVTRHLDPYTPDELACVAAWLRAQPAPALPDVPDED